jgi:hypothetical protein
VSAVDTLYLWTDRVLFWGLVALRAWAVLDCVVRKSAAFPAVDKMTKPAWLLILVLAGVFGTLIVQAPIAPLSLITIVPATVYLADVRPAVREIADGR